jgi:hypothetical protein
MSRMARAVAITASGIGLAAAAALTAAPASAAPAVPTVQDAVWSCSGIPAGYVSLQIDPYRCGGTGPGHLVSAPASGQWICGWNGNALDGYVIDVTETTSTRCYFNTSWHIVAI